MNLDSSSAKSDNVPRGMCNKRGAYFSVVLLYEQIQGIKRKNTGNGAEKTNNMKNWQEMKIIECVMIDCNLDLSG